MRVKILWKTDTQMVRFMKEQMDGQIDKVKCNISYTTAFELPPSLFRGPYPESVGKRSAKTYSTIKVNNNETGRSYLENK